MPDSVKAISSTGKVATPTGHGAHFPTERESAKPRRVKRPVVTEADVEHPDDPQPMPPGFHHIDILA